MSETVRHTLQIQIDQLTHEILNATEKAWEAQKAKQQKQNDFWLDEKRKLTYERTKLQKKLHQTPAEDDSIKPQTRQEIKDRIISLNKQARTADKNMRRALADKELSQANRFLRQRNQLNAEVKNLNKLLNPVDSNAVDVTDTGNKAKAKQHHAPTTKSKPLNDNEIRQEVKVYKSKAQEADIHMRLALKEKKLEKANELLQQRNYLNTEAKKRLDTLSTSAPEIATETLDNILSDKALKDKIRQYNRQARQADTKMRTALAEKRLLDANGLLRQRNKFNNDARKGLEQLKAQQAIEKNKRLLTDTIAPPEKVLTREVLKKHLKAANTKALAADQAMRVALEDKKYKEANRFLQKRNFFNAKAREITLLLNPITIPSIPSKSLPSSAVKEPIVKEEEAIVETQPVTFTTAIAQKIINYRLRFIHFFYKKRDLQALISAEQKKSAKTSNRAIAILNNQLLVHLKRLPKAYVEDDAHNDIILHLLNQVDERGVAYFNFPEISKTTIGAPLKQLRSQKDLIDFIQDYTEKEPNEGSGKRVLLKYFIRDIIHVKSPLTICDLVLEDAIMDTLTMEHGFVNLFNKIVNKANQEIIRLQNENDNPLMPKVLSPIGRFDCVGHRDAIQLIPPAYDGIDRYTGSILADTTLQDNIIASSAKLQGIFATDGAFDNLKIINNKISTEGDHKICILGMLSGEITANTDLDGNALPIKIQPLRLGGGTALTNFFVLGFSPQCSYQYGHIEGVSGTKNDRRSKKVVRGNKAYDQRKYLLDFNMDRFIEHYQCHTKTSGRFHAIKDCVEHMLREGDAVKCNSASLDALEQDASLQEAIEIATYTKKPVIRCNKELSNNRNKHP